MTDLSQLPVEEPPKGWSPYFLLLLGALLILVGAVLAASLGPGAR